MGGSQNPVRQQMINMMYLVLTALLALNVSAEILNAFNTVNNSMYSSIELIDVKNKGAIGGLEELYANNPVKTKPYYDKAKEVQKKVSEFSKYLEDLKLKLIEMSGDEGLVVYNAKETKGQIVGQSNIDIPAQVMIAEKTGLEVKKRVIKLRNEMIKIYGTNQDSTYKITKKEVDLFVKNNIPLNIIEPKKTGGIEGDAWTYSNFHMVPTIAAVTLLTKIQIDAKTSEANILEALRTGVGAKEMTFDAFIPVVKAPKSSIALGGKYEAEILLAAYSSTQNPQIFVDGKELKVEAGKAIYEGGTGSLGEQNHKGKIVQMNDKTGEKTEYPFEFSYDVFKSPAIISADAMRVFYAGLDNPVSISVPGYKPKDIMASITSGSLINKGGGRYAVNVQRGRGRPKPVFISVSVRTGKGSKFVGKEKFRIKSVPRPTGYFGKASGDISVGQLKATQYVTARMGDFVFDGLKYSVVGYEAIFKPKKGNVLRRKVNGPRMPGEITSRFGRAQKGAMIIITNIKVRAKGKAVKNVGVQRLESGIVLTVK